MEATIQQKKENSRHQRGFSSGQRDREKWFHHGAPHGQERGQSSEGEKDTSW